MTAPTSRRRATLSFDLLGLDVGEGTPERLAGDTAGDWLPAVVPGGVHESLIAAGRVPHPYVGANERRDAWIETKEWWYRARFTAPVPGAGEHLRLVCEGLDTVADLWLDGRPLGHHANQFRPAEFDVTDRADGAEHVLLIRFTPPLLGREVPPVVAEATARLAALVQQVTGEADAEPVTLGSGRSGVATAVRKAAFSWGWDFGPDVPSVGVWRPVRLSVEPDQRITGHHVALTDLAPDHAHGTVRVLVETARHTPGVTARVVLTDPAGRRHTARAPLGEDGTATAELRLDHPALWWTHDLGPQHLHDVRIDLLDADGAPLDERHDRVGLRTIALDRGDPSREDGRRFAFVLNGRRVFARGANWVPASTLVGSVPDAVYRDRVRRAREGNMTMLRVWGGGIYEADAFYAACDEQGVLVWQDFMFACNPYPSDDQELLREVEHEAAYQVARLRNRACLALWCGNNEVQMIRLGDTSEGGWGWHFFHRALPDAVRRHDGLVPYWPGSPYGEGGPLAVAGPEDGDRHNWEVWHGMPSDWTAPETFPTPGDARHYRRYAAETGRFVSEFGIRSAPDAATLRRWLPEEEVRLDSDVLLAHDKDLPAGKLEELLAVTTGLPRDLDEHIAFSQAVQAEGMAFAVAHLRRRQPVSAGALIWQFNDAWPGFTWSLLDFDGVPKAAYWAAARACAPVAVSFRDAGDGLVELWLVNNGPVPVAPDIDVETGDFRGTTRHVERVRGAADPGTAVLVWTGRPPRDARHYVWADSPAAAFPAARLHFAEIGRLDTGPSSLRAVPDDGGVTIVSTGYSYGVRIEHPDPLVRLSDNWFDLRDGERRRVTVTGTDDLSALRVTSFPFRADPF